MELSFALPSSADAAPLARATFVGLGSVLSDRGEAGIPYRPEPPAGDGWRLQLVDAIVSGWGVREGSTHVWFEIDRS